MLHINVFILIHFCRCSSESIHALLTEISFAIDPSTYATGNFSQVSYFPVNILASKTPSLPSQYFQQHSMGWAWIFPGFTPWLPVLTCISNLLSPCSHPFSSKWFLVLAFSFWWCSVLNVPSVTKIYTLIMMSSIPIPATWLFPANPVDVNLLFQRGCNTFSW